LPENGCSENDLIQYWKGYVLETGGGRRDTFLARFETACGPEEDIEAEMLYMGLDDPDDILAIRDGTFLEWKIYDNPPRSHLYIPDYGKRLVTAEDIAEAKRLTASWKELFGEPDIVSHTTSDSSSDRS
jgi:hypothetical protein